MLTSLLPSSLMRALVDTYWRAVVRQVAAVGTELVLYEHARRNSQRIRMALSIEELAAIRRIVESGGSADVPADAPQVHGPSPLAVEAMLREAGWEAFRSLPNFFQDRHPHPRWTDGVRAAVADAMATAASHGAERPHGGHLLLGLIAGPDSGASRLLRAAGADRDEVIRALSIGEQLRQTGEPWVPALEVLRFSGVIDVEKTDGWLYGLLTRIVGRVVSGFRFSYGWGSPLANCLQIESLRQAVRFGDHAVRPRHVALAILAIDDQLAVVRKQLPPRIAQNTGAAVLREHNVTYGRLVGPVTDLDAEAADIVFDPPELIFAPIEPTMPQWTAPAAAVWPAARAHADRLGHRHTDTAHLLLALLDDPSGETARLLHACAADPEFVREQLSTSLAD